jgi:glycosyltransferase involved in cell wall biosynthesis
MKILLIPSIYLPSVGGVQINTNLLAKSLIKSGDQVFVLTSNWRQWKSKIIEKRDGIVTYRLPFYIPRGSLKSFLAFFLLLPSGFIGCLFLMLAIRPDIINVHFIGANAFYVLISHKLLRKPLVVTLHGNEVTSVPNPLEIGYTQLECKILRWTADRILGRADYITAVSNYLIREASKLDIQILKKARRIFFINSEKIEPHSSSTKSAQPYILAVGRLEAEKGFDLLITAFKNVSVSCPMNLIIVGDGRETSVLKNMIKELALENNVHLIGNVERKDLGAYYENARFIVVPSRREGLSNVILEAFSFGKPVVGSRVGGIPEVLIDGFNGLLFQRGDVEHLTAILRRLLEDKELYEKLSTNVRAMFKKMTIKESLGKTYHMIYEKAYKKFYEKVNGKNRRTYLTA